jgi:hypothetical protein
MVGKDGINDDRRVVPVEGSEATIKGLSPFPFAIVLIERRLKNRTRFVTRQEERLKYHVSL